MGKYKKINDMVTDLITLLIEQGVSPEKKNLPRSKNFKISVAESNLLENSH
ncbi:MAG: hypothetical protein GY730_08270 [bacterium]|nr:hypothetical protein [bacterium]